MDKFKEIIAHNKSKGNKQPKYSLRKLSVGMVSCIIGMVLFGVSLPVSGAEIINPQDITEVRITEDILDKEAIPLGDALIKEETEEVEKGLSIESSSNNPDSDPGDKIIEENTDNAEDKNSMEHQDQTTNIISEAEVTEDNIDSPEIFNSESQLKTIEKNSQDLEDLEDLEVGITLVAQNIPQDLKVEEKDPEVIMDSLEEPEDVEIIEELPKVNIGESLKERKISESIKDTLFLKGVDVKEEDFKLAHNNSSTKVSDAGKSNYFQTEHNELQGYYDINKKFDGKDNNLCSGAVVSNMMHWWLNNNDEYVKKYFEESSDNAVIKLSENPNKENKDLRILRSIYQVGDSYSDQSKLFDFVKEAFPTGNPIAPEKLINLFINGHSYLTDWEKAKAIESTFNNPVSSNFFNKVFKGKLLSAYENISNIDTFTESIKKAINEEKAIGISYGADKYVTLGHIVSVWGADFDNTGRISAVYITDSDDGKITGSQYMAGMKRFKVNTDSKGYLRLSGYSEANSGGTLRHLYTLDSGKKEWEEYFKKSEKITKEDKLNDLAKEDTENKIQSENPSYNDENITNTDAISNSNEENTIKESDELVQEEVSETEQTEESPNFMEEKKDEPTNSPSEELSTNEKVTDSTENSENSIPKTDAKDDNPVVSQGTPDTSATENSENNQSLPLVPLKEAETSEAEPTEELTDVSEEIENNQINPSSSSDELLEKDKETDSAKTSETEITNTDTRNNNTSATSETPDSSATENGHDIQSTEPLKEVETSEDESTKEAIDVSEEKEINQINPSSSSDELPEKDKETDSAKTSETEITNTDTRNNNTSAAQETPDSLSTENGHDIQSTEPLKEVETSEYESTEEAIVVSEEKENNQISSSSPSKELSDKENEHYSGESSENSIPKTDSKDDTKVATQESNDSSVAENGNDIKLTETLKEAETPKPETPEAESTEEAIVVSEEKENNQISSSSPSEELTEKENEHYSGESSENSIPKTDAKDDNLVVSQETNNSSAAENSHDVQSNNTLKEVETSEDESTEEAIVVSEEKENNQISSSSPSEELTEKENETYLAEPSENSIPKTDSIDSIAIASPETPDLSATENSENNHSLSLVPLKEAVIPENSTLSEAENNESSPLPSLDSNTVLSDTNVSDNSDEHITDSTKNIINPQADINYPEIINSSNGEKNNSSLLKENNENKSGEKTPEEKLTEILDQKQNNTDDVESISETEDRKASDGDTNKIPDNKIGTIIELSSSDLQSKPEEIEEGTLKFSKYGTSLTIKNGNQKITEGDSIKTISIEIPNGFLIKKISSDEEILNGLVIDIDNGKVTGMPEVMFDADEIEKLVGIHFIVSDGKTSFGVKDYILITRMDVENTIDEEQSKNPKDTIEDTITTPQTEKDLSLEELKSRAQRIIGELTELTEVSRKLIHNEIANSLSSEDIEKITGTAIIMNEKRAALRNNKELEEKLIEFTEEIDTPTKTNENEQSIKPSVSITDSVPSSPLHHSDSPDNSVTKRNVSSSDSKEQGNLNAFDEKKKITPNSQISKEKDQIKPKEKNTNIVAEIKSSESGKNENLAFINKDKESTETKTIDAKKLPDTGSSVSHLPILGMTSLLSSLILGLRNKKRKK